MDDQIPDPSDSAFRGNVRSILAALRDNDEALAKVKGQRDAIFQRARDLGLSPKFIRKVHKLEQLDAEVRIQQDRMLNVYRRAADVAMLLEAPLDTAA